MALIKMRGWQLLIVKMIVLPVLGHIANTIEKKAEETPQEWDDVLVGAFKSVIAFLHSPEAFEET